MMASAFAPAPVTCNGLAAGEAGQGFKAGADPLEPSNRRYFSLNSNGQIFEDSVSLFAAMPESGDSPTGHVLR